MNITKHDKMLMSKLMMVLLFSCSLISSVVMAEEEAAIPADKPAPGLPGTTRGHRQSLQPYSPSGNGCFQKGSMGSRASA